MNVNTMQAVQDEEQGLDEEVEDIDWDAVYGGLDIDIGESMQSPEVKKGYAELFKEGIDYTGKSIKEAVQQGAKNLLIGAGGAYGDLLDLVGFNKPNELEDVKNRREFATLKKMDQPGYKPSLADIHSLSDEGISPGASRLSTSSDLEKISDALGGPGQPETVAGRTAERTGRIAGAGAAFGALNPVPAVAAGALGQTAEELGGGPLVQAAAEIVGLIGSHRLSGKPLVGSAKADVQEKIQALRDLGYTEEQITLAVNSANKKAAQGASKGFKTEQALTDFAEHSEDLVGNILRSEVPGIERGTQHVHQMASDAYGKVAEEASKIRIPNSTPFINSATDVVKQLRKNLGKTPDAESFLNRLHDAVIASTNNPTAESYMNFYKELNKAGQWLGRSDKDRLLTHVKNGIKDTFKSEGPQGKALAEKFEKVNAGIRKAYQAEEVSNIIQKATTQDGMDFKKLYKAFDNPENVEVMQDVLGKQQAKNLNLIAKTGKEIKDFDKAWKGTSSKIIDAARLATGVKFLYDGNYEGLALVGLSKLGPEISGRLREKMLTDPKYQNLVIRGLHAIKTESPRSLQSVNHAMQKYLDEEGLDIDLSNAK